MCILTSVATAQMEATGTGMLMRTQLAGRHENNASDDQEIKETRYMREHRIQRKSRIPVDCQH